MIIVYGQEYRIGSTHRYIYIHGSTLQTDVTENGELLLAKLGITCVSDGDVHLHARRWFVRKFSTASLSYCCTLGEDVIYLYLKDVTDFKPLNNVQCIDEVCTFNHIVFCHQLYTDKVHCLEDFSVAPQQHNFFIAPFLLSYTSMMLIMSTRHRFWKRPFCLAELGG